METSQSGEIVMVMMVKEFVMRIVILIQALIPTASVIVSLVIMNNDNGDNDDKKTGTTGTNADVYALLNTTKARLAGTQEKYF